METIKLSFSCPDLGLSPWQGPTAATTRDPHPQFFHISLINTILNFLRNIESDNDQSLPFERSLLRMSGLISFTCFDLGLVEWERKRVRQ